jgi:hypothetical protein
MTLTRKDNLVHLGLPAQLTNELETQVAPLADPRLTAPNLIQETAADGVVARAGGGQANATAITTQTTRVITVAAPGDSVVLPPSQPGLELIIINHGINPMQVYGLGSDMINDVASATGVSQMQGSVVIYTCVSTGAWYTEGLATGYATGNGGAFQTFSSIDNIAARAGGGQALATALTAMQNRITTVASAGDSVKLPPSTTGMSLTVINAAAANSVNVFPASGESIDALSLNAARAIAANKTSEFFCVTAGQWHSLITA